ncbi:Myocyte-Specific Enhancer Factor 2C [Manis pentadactyla]|nr:Myocyte-Specific Enhancer Factor 2C [Manis pentadactyla]
MQLQNGKGVQGEVQPQQRKRIKETSVEKGFQRHPSASCRRGERLFTHLSQNSALGAPGTICVNVSSGAKTHVI